MTNPETPERITYRIAALRALTATSGLGVPNPDNPLRETIDLRVPVDHMDCGEWAPGVTEAVDLAMRHIAIAANREPDTIPREISVTDLLDTEPDVAVLFDPHTYVAALCRRAATSLAREVEPSRNDRGIARRTLVHLAASIADGTTDLYHTTVFAAVRGQLRLYQGMSDHPTCVIRAALTGLGNMVGDPVPGKTILCDLHPGSGFLDVHVAGLLPEFIRRAAATIDAPGHCVCGARTDLDHCTVCPEVPGV